jgi:hypothetical protein
LQSINDSFTTAPTDQSPPDNRSFPVPDAQVPYLFAYTVTLQSMETDMELCSPLTPRAPIQEYHTETVVRRGLLSVVSPAVNRALTKANSNSHSSLLDVDEPMDASVSDLVL